MRRLVIGGAAAVLLLGSGATVALSGDGPNEVVVGEGVSHRPDTLRFDAARDCPGTASSTIADHVAGGGAPTRDEALRPVLAEFSREHGPVTLRRTREGETYRVDDAHGTPVGEISVVQAGPEAWQVAGHTMCVTSWVGDGEIPPPDQLTKDGGGRKIRIEHSTGKPSSDKVTVRFIGAPEPASKRCGKDYVARVDETPATVTITVIVRRVGSTALGCTDIGAEREVVADLMVPLGARRILDGTSTGASSTSPPPPAVR